MASPGADYFGFVNGGTLPVALGAAFVTAAWDRFRKALQAPLPPSAPEGRATGPTPAISS